jgi:hypothetical protein
MRRIVTFLVLVLILVTAAAYLLAVVAPSLAGAGLRAAGLRSQSLTVQIQADPPLPLLIGRADRMQVEGQGVAFGTFEAAAMTAEVQPVDLLDPNVMRFSGRFEGAAIGSLPLGTVTVAGTLPTVSFQAVIPTETVRQLAASATGAPAADITLQAPATIGLSIGGQALTGTLSISADGRSLLVSSAASGGPITLIQLPADPPLVIRGLAVGPAGLELTGTLRLPWF